MKRTIQHVLRRLPTPILHVIMSACVDELKVTSECVNKTAVTDLQVDVEAEIVRRR